MPSLWAPGFSDGSVQNSGQNLVNIGKQHLVGTSARPLSRTVTLTLKLVFYPCSFSTSSVYIRKLRVRGKRGTGPRKEWCGAENDFESDRGYTVSSSTYQTAGLLANMLLLRPSVILICKMGSTSPPSQVGGVSGMIKCPAQNLAPNQC